MEVSVMPREPIEYELRIGEDPAFEGSDYDGVLTSPLLDPTMHPDRAAAVYIVPQGGVVGSDGEAQLDPFQHASLVEYLSSQRYVRETLEREIPIDQEEWDPDGPSVRGNIWAFIEILRVVFRLRQVPKPADLEKYKARFGEDSEDFQVMLAAADTPQTRSFFTVTIKCSWDDEHRLEAEFRDGKFRFLTH